MKKIIKYIFTILVMFIFASNVYAANASISVTSSNNQVIVGKTVTVYVTVSSGSPLGSWEYTLNFDNSVFSLVSSDVGLHYASYANNPSTKSKSYAYTFKALKSGSCKFYIDSSAVVGWDESLFTVSDGSKTIKTLSYAEYQASLSANNNLKSLEVEGYDITPIFDKDTMEYSVKVSEDTKTVKINAVAEDRKATINGAGEVEVNAGNNTIDIVVIAENGSEKVYKLSVEVIDKDPINVNVDGKNFTVVKIKDNLIKPESFTETTIKINEYDIPAFYSEVTEFTLVGLKDSDGNIQLYIYDDGEYTKYIELNLGNISVYPLEMNEKIKGYNKSKVSIIDNDIECLEIKKSSRFKIIYGINVETNEKGLFIYDTKDNSLIKYDDDYMSKQEKQMQLYFYLTIGFACTTIISLILTIVVISKKKTKKIKQPKEEKKEIIHEEETNDLEVVEEESVEENEIVENSEEETYDIFEDDRKKKKKKK